MQMNTETLRAVHTDEYGFKMVDLTVAAMIKAYLQSMKVEAAQEKLREIVSPAVQELHGGTVKARKLPKEQWSEIEGEALAALIDDARAAATISAMEWQAQEEEPLLQKTIDFMRDNLFPMLSGEDYVASMPAEMAEFITDCWLAVA